MGEDHAATGATAYEFRLRFFWRALFPRIIHNATASRRLDRDALLARLLFLGLFVALHFRARKREVLVINLEASQEFGLRGFLLDNRHVRVAELLRLGDEERVRVFVDSRRVVSEFRDVVLRHHVVLLVRHILRA